MIPNITDLNYDIFTADHARSEESRLFFGNSYQLSWVETKDSKLYQEIEEFEP
jgi:hypothetical protein